MPRLVVVALAAVAGASCVRSIDVYVANPCGHPVEVETFRVAPAELRPAELVRRATIDANEVVLVEGAFDDAAGDVWSVKVEDDVFRVEKSDLVNDTFVLPAVICDAGPT